MPDPPLALLIVAASASLFVPLSGWLAGQRARSIPLWALFGGVLGPLAPALLLAAPPGQCPDCRRPVRGWRRRCVACGTDVRTGAPALIGFLIEEGSHELGERLAPVSSNGNGSERSASLAPRRHGRSAVREAAPAPSGALTQRADPRLTAAVGGDGGWAPRAAATALGRRPADAPSPPTGATHTGNGGHVARPAAGPTASRSASTFAILGSGVYVGGNRPLQAGSRYLLARMGQELQVLGPVHLNPANLADRVRLSDVDALVVEQRLVIGGREPRIDVAMAFVALAFERDVDIEQALHVRRRRAVRPG